MADEFHPIANRIETLLKDGGFWYERFVHEPVRTSEEAARVRPEYALFQGMKSLIVKGKLPKEGKHFIMIVVSGGKQFDKQKLREATGYTDVRFATEAEVHEITGGILPGGVPPFGNLFGLSVYVDIGVFENEKVIFNAGDRRVSLAIRSQDYGHLVHPTILSIV